MSYKDELVVDKKTKKRKKKRKSNEALNVFIVLFIFVACMSVFYFVLTRVEDTNNDGRLIDELFRGKMEELDLNNKDVSMLYNIFVEDNQLKLEYGERTPVFLKENSRHRKFGCWYLRIRPRSRVANPLEGIIKIEKMAVIDDEDGLDSAVVDNICLSILNEGSPTCYGRDERWASHLYPVYLTETLIKSSFESDLVFINNFKRDFK